VYDILNKWSRERLIKSLTTHTPSWNIPPGRLPAALLLRCLWVAGHGRVEIHMDSRYVMGWVRKMELG